MPLSAVRRKDRWICCGEVTEWGCGIMPVPMPRFMLLLLELLKPMEESKPPPSAPPAAAAAAAAVVPNPPPPSPRLSPSPSAAPSGPLLLLSPKLMFMFMPRPRPRPRLPFKPVPGPGPIVAMERGLLPFRPMLPLPSCGGGIDIMDPERAESGTRLEGRVSMLRARWVCWCWCCSWICAPVNDSSLNTFPREDEGDAKE